MSFGTPTVHKDLSLDSLIPKWSGSESETPLEEFLSTIEASARIGKWQELYKIEVATLRLTGAAKICFNGCPELHAEDITWDKFKKTFRDRFSDVHTDQFHFTNLQTARQMKNESPQAFADRCRILAQKILHKTDDHVPQLIHKEYADRMLLAGFTSKLIGEPGKQVRFRNPQSFEQALTNALSVQQAENQEKFNESFYASCENSVKMVSQSPTRTPHENSRSRHTADTTHAASRIRGQHNSSSRKQANDLRH
jgi:hypothetical protein